MLRGRAALSRCVEIPISTQRSEVLESSSVRERTLGRAGTGVGDPDALNVETIGNVGIPAADPQAALHVPAVVDALRGLPYPYDPPDECP